MGTLVDSGVGVWGFSRASDIVSLETDVAMETLVLLEEAPKQEEKASSGELSYQYGTCFWQDGRSTSHRTRAV